MLSHRGWPALLGYSQCAGLERWWRGKAKAGPSFTVYKLCASIQPTLASGALQRTARITLVGRLASPHHTCRHPFANKAFASCLPCIAVVTRLGVGISPPCSPRSQQREGEQYATGVSSRAPTGAAGVLAREGHSLHGCGAGCLAESLAVVRSRLLLMASRS